MTSKPPHKTLESLEQNDNVCVARSMEGVFTDEECERIIALSDHMPVVEGQINALDGDKLNTVVRDSLTMWLRPGSETNWVFNRLRDYALEANKFYKYEFYGFHGIQIARYGTGGHYTWHMDVGSGENSLRKLSISVQLSAPEDYDGGELEFNTVMDKGASHGKKRGSAIFFPSFMDHRVAPVTRGIRWSLVIWLYGPPFR